MYRLRFRDSDGKIRTGEWERENDDEHRSVNAETGRIISSDETFSPDEVDVLAPTEPTKIVCIGLNYEDHAEEQGSDIPERPMLFLKAPNAVAHPGQTIELLPNKERIDHEAELGVVIEEECRNVERDDAMDVVAGFTCVNDISNRDDQRREQNWVRGKAFDGAAPMGPVLATPDEVPADATIELRVNGEIRQQSNRKNLLFSIPALIEEITAYLTLEPGDVIATGTPAGVGPLVDGDTVEVEIEGIGTLSHSVRTPDG